MCQHLLLQYELGRLLVLDASASLADVDILMRSSISAFASFAVRRSHYNNGTDVRCICG